MSRNVKHVYSMTKLLGTNGWCRGLVHSNILFPAQCSQLVLAPGSKRKRYCRNDATHARWVAGIQCWERPLCTQHFKALEKAGGTAA